MTSPVALFPETAWNGRLSLDIFCSVETSNVTPSRTMLPRRETEFRAERSLSVPEIRKVRWGAIGGPRCCIVPRQIGLESRIRLQFSALEFASTRNRALEKLTHSLKELDGKVTHMIYG